jgi:hypothetical protein
MRNTVLDKTATDFETAKFMKSIQHIKNEKLIKILEE